MSYFSQLLHGRATAAETLAKSVGYLKRKLGITVSDEAVDAAVKATDEFTDALEAVVATYLAANLPALPAILAKHASTSVLNLIDSAVAGAGAVIKENN